MRRFFLLILFLAVAVCAFVWLVPVGPAPPSETFVEIAPGTSTRQIASQLQTQHIIRSRYAFEALRLFKGGTLKAGEYRFDHPARLSEVYGRLQHGDVYTVGLTVPEGANIFDIAQRVEAAKLGTRATFLKAAMSDMSLIKDIDPGAHSLEGYLFPDTYRFPKRVAPDQIVAAMVRQFRHSEAEIGLSRMYGNPMPPGARADLTAVHRVVTLASLIERESPIPAERPLVASVFVNRLAKGMPLDTDPSVIYAALLQGRYRGAIYQSDLAADSPYNTYRHEGLPPGPICNPGLASLRAAMAPAHTDYLYFVAASADPSGHSRFSSTLAEHSQDVQIYRRAIGEPEHSEKAAPVAPVLHPKSRRRHFKVR
ncbi:MAG TPA: endolytic transglycosylase MltG [Acidisarcina sp.]